MKKIIAGFLCGVLGLQLMACSTATPEGTTTQTQETEASEEGAQEETAEEETQEAAQETEEAAQETEKAVDENGTHIVVDHAGNEVEVPNQIDRIVIDQIPILSTYMAYFNGEMPYIVGLAGSFKDTIEKTVLKDIAPEVYEASDTVYAKNDLNMEEIVKLEPDVIFYNAGNKEHAEVLKKSGIPAVGFATTGMMPVNGKETPADPLQRYDEWLQLLEDVFGEDGKMDEFLAKGDAIVADVEARIAEIPEDKRPSAMVLFRYQEGVPQVAGQGVFPFFWLKHLGVKNVAGETKGFAQVSFEEIYGWNPEIMFISGPGHSPVTVTDILENKLEGADFSSIKAVEDQRVYNTLLGMWSWVTPNPDAPLILAWMACQTYPEEFADYPLEETIREYYKEFYGYEITEEDMATMLEYK